MGQDSALHHPRAQQQGALHQLLPLDVGVGVEVGEGILLDHLNARQLLGGNTHGHEVDGNVLRDVYRVGPLGDRYLIRYSSVSRLLINNQYNFVHYFDICY